VRLGQSLRHPGGDVRTASGRVELDWPGHPAGVGACVHVCMCAWVCGCMGIWAHVCMCVCVYGTYVCTVYECVCKKYTRMGVWVVWCVSVYECMVVWLYRTC